VKRRFLLFLTLAMVALTAVALAKSKPRGTTIKLGNTSMGKILTKNSGFTVYVFSHDKKNKDTCVKIAGCTDLWPPVTTKAKPIAGSGIKASLLGTIKLPNGSHQVTYNGKPLYTYSADFSPRQTDYVGQSQFGGTWYAVGASGKVVK
jgi:predicted lipoprotein with Yx(FWY)xxD motif